MDDSMKLYWELYFKNFPNDKIISQITNPIREYEDELIDGAIIDIGCGQSPILLDFSWMDREIIAVDNEQSQLNFLKQRALKIEDCNIDNWKFCLLEYPKEDIPDKIYSLIIFADFLHFFSLKECIGIAEYIQKNTAKGTLIYVRVHSHKYYKNNPNDPNNNDYFKHYFTPEDLETVFKKGSFERIYIAEIEKIDSKDERSLVSKFLDKSYRLDGITNQKKIDFYKSEYLKDKTESYIMAIFRKR